ncbi:MAG: membrane protein insertion efficiency factor YidD [Gammaproteobacteria bacterium]|nr:membrane protein insertion efficiency factor YidD [Gammaproteobacteria bacterium]MCY4227149.1 membrane protein insertion efficiency factor YidD [Gammaproteobacteria bacterium]MCY4312441.1 membrane protein insertion efficiency factor YidD [Gammaproteobacteria bacterium]
MSKPKVDLPRRCLRFLIRAYQLAVSPYLGSNCRYYPCCSRYALEAIDEHGACKGSLLTIRRIARCHPWNAGGYDPVPGKSSDPEQT